jgi:hypothetical protein
MTWKMKSAAVTLAACLWALPSQAVGLKEMEDRSVEIALRYLAMWSSSDDRAAVESVPSLYEPSVVFYRQVYSHRKLIEEKRRAVRRWPIRRYVHRPGAMQVTCSVEEQRCAVLSVTDYEVSNPARHATRRGSAKFSLGISFRGREPRIFWEGGSIGRRG